MSGVEFRNFVASGTVLIDNAYSKFIPFPRFLNVNQYMKHCRDGPKIYPEFEISKIYRKMSKAI